MIALLCGGIDDSAAGGSSHDSSLASDVVDNNFGRRRHQFGYFGKKRRMSLLDLFVANTSFILWLMIVRGRRASNGKDSFCGRQHRASIVALLSGNIHDSFCG